jgi:hypothetical protein
MAANIPSNQYLTRDQAIEIARRCAKAKPQSYYAEPFQPHEWVIDAILQASNRQNVALQKVMARLADLLDSDQFNNIEAIVLEAGVPYPETAIPTEQFDELATAYDLTAGRERADALRWFMLGRRSRDETTAPPAFRDSLVQIRERAFRLSIITCPDTCSEWTHPLCWIARTADAALRETRAPHFFHNDGACRHCGQIAGDHTIDMRCRSAVKTGADPA